MDTDPITLELLHSRLVGLMDEAAATLVRTAFSSVVRDAHDYGIVLLTPRGEIIAENSYGLAAFCTVLPKVAKNILQTFPSHQWSEGDVVVTNDPWLGLGHLLDMAMLSPILLDGALVAFVGSIAHVPDLGGTVFSADGEEVFEEGILIPPVFAMSRGTLDETLFLLLEANNRVPEQFMGDFFARIAAADGAAVGLEEVMSDFGFSNLDVPSQAMFDLGEQSMRQAILEVPDGVYDATIKTDGLDSGEPLTISVRVEIMGSEINVDYAGTSPQQRKAINCCLSETEAQTKYALKCVLDRSGLRNEGTYGPISVTVPEGALLNARFPAALNARQVSTLFLCGVLFEALAPVIPDRVIAQCGAPHVQVVYSRSAQHGEPFTLIVFDPPGMGGTPHADGLNATHYPANVALTPLEIIEATTPFQVLKREIVCDSGGPGRYRGGCGIEVSMRLNGASPVAMKVLGDRMRHPAKGLSGGLEGGLAAISVDGARPAPPLTGKDRLTLYPGDVATYRQGGGGGYGLPTRRPREDILRDIRDGYISQKAATQRYGLDQAS